MPRRRNSRRLPPLFRLAAISLPFLILQGCAEATGPRSSGPATAELRLSANVSATNIDILVATVIAADLPRSLVYNMQAVGGFASATLRIPAGVERTILVQAFESGGEITHEGQITIDVKPGPNPPVEIHLVPRPGNVPVTVMIGAHSVEVQPASVELPLGGSTQLEAFLFSANGQIFDAVDWASTNPAIATVDANGVVTAGMVDGTVEIVAMYMGVAGAAIVTVGGGGQPAESQYVGTASLIRSGAPEVNTEMWPAGYCEPECPFGLAVRPLGGGIADLDIYIDGELFAIAQGAFDGQIFLVGGAYETILPSGWSVACYVNFTADFSALPTVTGAWTDSCTMLNAPGLTGGFDLSFVLTQQE